MKTFYLVKSLRLRFSTSQLEDSEIKSILALLESVKLSPMDLHVEIGWNDEAFNRSSMKTLKR